MYIVDISEILNFILFPIGHLDPSSLNNFLDNQLFKKSETTNILKIVKKFEFN